MQCYQPCQMFVSYTCNYNIRLPTFQLPLIKHASAEQRLDYQLIKILNANGSQAVIMKAESVFFMALKPL